MLYDKEIRKFKFQYNEDMKKSLYIGRLFLGFHYCMVRYCDSTKLSDTLKFEVQHMLT